MTYGHKVAFAIKLLQSIPQDKEVELCYSTGKDSDVILELAKMAGIKFRPIYKSTSIDPVGSIKHAKEMGVEILRPKKTFFELMRQKGAPSRFVRFCCSELKEYPICEIQIIGVRKSESKARADRYNEPEQCRKYGNNKKAIAYYPILSWTDEDVERFIDERGIKCHPIYYDDKDIFHVERRVGCMGCPMTSYKKQRDEFLKYPKLLKLWIKNIQKYLDTHPNVKMHQSFESSPYNVMFMRLFCDNNFAKYKRLMCGGIFGDEMELDTKKILEDYFKIDLTI